jgi:hypothetical protein
LVADLLTVSGVTAKLEVVDLRQRRVQLQ